MNWSVFGYKSDDNNHDENDDDNNIIDVDNNDHDGLKVQWFFIIILFFSQVGLMLVRLRHTSDDNDDNDDYDDGDEAFFFAEQNGEAHTWPCSQLIFFSPCSFFFLK